MISSWPSRSAVATVSLSIVVLLLVYELVELRLVPPPEAGIALKNPERSQPFDTSEFTIGTYNIRYGKGLEERPSLQQIADVLSSPELDLIGLNEVRMGPFSDASQAEMLADLLDMSWVYAMTVDRYFERRAGNAILSRYHIERYEIVPLFQTQTDLENTYETRSRRNYVFVLLDNGEHQVAVIATHIDRGPLQPEQIDQVLRRFDQFDHAVLIGDMNNVHSQVAIAERLRDGALDAICEGHDHEAPHIDWILTKGFDVIESGLHPVGVSDHPQYWARLRIQQEGVEVASAL